MLYSLKKRYCKFFKLFIIHAAKNRCVNIKPLLHQAKLQNVFTFQLIKATSIVYARCALCACSSSLCMMDENSAKELGFI